MSHLAPSHSSWCLLCQQRRHGHCTGTCQCPTCHPADGGPQVSETQWHRLKYVIKFYMLACSMGVIGAAIYLWWSR